MSKRKMIKYITHKYDNWYRIGRVDLKTHTRTIAYITGGRTKKELQDFIWAPNNVNSNKR